ncbi:MAG: hypothetical protein KDE53_34535, partial [Caldilineaceae bacterium]|nr:hypothetical protein [Caldilineaceae bacterium]
MIAVTLNFLVNLPIATEDIATAPLSIHLCSLSVNPGTLSIKPGRGCVPFFGITEQDQIDRP